MKKRKVLKAINHIVTIFVFTVLLTMLFMVISMRASGGEAASLFGYQIKSVLSGSMEPNIQTGSVITVKETDNNHHFKKNDVITFKTTDKMVVTHRIQQIQEDGQSYKTKGDANDAMDIEPALQENIIGVYTGFTIPYIGYGINFVNSRDGAALLLVIPGLGFVIYSVLLIGKALRSIDQRKSNEESHTK